MPVYAVTIQDGKNLIELELTAVDKDSAHRYASRTGRVVAIKKKSAWATGAVLSAADRQIFFSRVAAMLKSKVGTSEALRLMRDTFKGPVGRMCGRMLTMVEASGIDLATSLERIGPPNFPATTVALIKAGARGGNTPQAIKDAAKFEWEMEHVRGGSMKAIGMAVFGLVGALVTNVASTHYMGPSVMGSGMVSAGAKMKDGINIDWVHTMSDITSGIIALILLALVCLVMLSSLLKRVLPVAADGLIQKIPYYKDLVLAQKNFISLYGLSVLVRSGISIEEALQLSADAADPGALKEDFKAARNAMKQGQRWAFAMKSLHPTDQAALSFAMDRIHVADTLEALADQYRSLYQQRVETVGPALQLVGAIFMVIAGGVMFAETIMPMLMASRNLL